MREACCANALEWKYVMVNVRLEGSGVGVRVDRGLHIPAFMKSGSLS